ncbi:MAG: ATP synthase subunit B family protein [Acidimicrobiales bacterium]|jgi:dsDNA-specific endonuclease/ATPase MutS2
MMDVFEDDAPGDDAALDRTGEDLGADELIRRAIDVVTGAKAMPLSASVLVSREELLGILHTALERLPDELRQARWLLREKEEFLAEREREAEALMADVRAQAEHMVSRSEVVRQANMVAQSILDDANDEARRLRHEAEDYCDQKLAGMEIVLERITRTVRAGREKLQATAPAPASHEGPLPEEEPGFFDQDLA